ncbi:MAG: hypothetical protein OIF50_04195 [Flavobacteriaceae bacterium]|nr:hypothetical protein [Flavobacteriaceae bacterium]
MNTIVENNSMKLAGETAIDPSVKFSELSELSEFLNFEVIKSKINKQELFVLFSDDRINLSFDRMAKARQKRIIILANFLPVLLALILGFLAYQQGNYWGVLLVPLTLGVLIGKPNRYGSIWMLSLLMLGSILFAFQFYNIAAPLMVLSSSILACNFCRIYKKHSLKHIALCSERLFLILFRKKILVLESTDCGRKIEKQ